MPKASYHFPRDVMWGTATAAHQVEGSNNNNNWSAWENEPGRILHGHRAGLACDWNFIRKLSGALVSHRPVKRGAALTGLKLH